MEAKIMAKVTAKYQITIPPEVRNDLDIVPGSEVDIRKEGDSYILLVDPIQGLKKRWRGKFKNKQTSEEYMNHVRGELE
jgi:AbrB family looped-hinge helix DNA binding protein